MKEDKRRIELKEQENMASMLRIGADQAKVQLLEQLMDQQSKHIEELHSRQAIQMKLQMDAAERQSQAQVFHANLMLHAVALGSAQSGADTVKILDIMNQQQQRHALQPNDDAHSGQQVPSLLLNPFPTRVLI